MADVERILIVGGGIAGLSLATTAPHKQSSPHRHQACSTLSDERTRNGLINPNSDFRNLPFGPKPVLRSRARALIPRRNRRSGFRPKPCSNSESPKWHRTQFSE